MPESNQKEKLREDLQKIIEDIQKRINKRNDILTAVLLHAYGRRAQRQDPRIRKILELVDQAESKLKHPGRADLKSEDDDEIWIICMADRIASAPNIQIETIDEARETLSKAVIPKTNWTELKFGEARITQMAEGIRAMEMNEKLG